jgi:hypothetical protein
MATTEPYDEVIYDADVDEMTAGGLAVLLEVRLRLASVPGAVEIVDAFAAEVLANVTDDEDEEGGES